MVVRHWCLLVYKHDYYHRNIWSRFKAGSPSNILPPAVVRCPPFLASIFILLFMFSKIRFFCLIKFLQNVTTPLLFIHYQNTHRFSNKAKIFCLFWYSVENNSQSLCITCPSMTFLLKGKTNNWSLGQETTVLRISVTKPYIYVYIVYKIRQMLWIYYSMHTYHVELFNILNNKIITKWYNYSITQFVFSNIIYF